MNLIEVEKFDLNNSEHVCWLENNIDDLPCNYLSNIYNIIDVHIKKSAKNAYSTYNIIDVNRVVRIDKKMKLIDLAIAFAYDSKINFSDVFGTVHPWDCAITNYLMDRNIVVPLQKFGEDPTIMGGFVKEPQKGRFPWVVSFDAAALYPHIIMMLNIGPDTLVDVVPGVDPDSIIDGKCNEILQESRELGYSVSGIGSRFRTDIQGFLSEMMESLYEERSYYKKEMLKWEAKLEVCQPEEVDDIEEQIATNNSKQMSRKIKGNALFGSLANVGSRYCSQALSEGITSTGQAGIKWAERCINEYLNKVAGTEGFDFVLAIDTDSLYINLYPIVKKYKKDGLPDKEIAAFCEEVCKKALSPHIQKKMLEFGNLLGAHKPEKVYFKLEKISQTNIHVAKKKYVSNVVYSEGVQYEEPKIKVTGLEAIRSNTPAFCKDYIKKAFKIMAEGTEDELQDLLIKAREEFVGHEFAVVARPTGVNGVQENTDPRTVFKKGTHINAKAAIIYNHYIKKMGLEKKYRLIYDSDKIKYVYLKQPNPVMATVIASPEDTLPPELEVDDYIDYELQFNKTIVTPIQNVLDVFGWSTEPKSNLFGFFS